MVIFMFLKLFSKRVLTNEKRFPIIKVRKRLRDKRIGGQNYGED